MILYLQMIKRNIQINNKAFTLVELVVVLITISVLVSLAMLKFVDLTESMKAKEAYSNMSRIKQRIEFCYSATESYLNCAEDKTAWESDVTSAQSHFSYDVVDITVNTYTIIATRNNLNDGNAGDTVVLEADINGFTRSGTGAFSGIN